MLKREREWTNPNPSVHERKKLGVEVLGAEMELDKFRQERRKMEEETKKGGELAEKGK